MMYLFGDRRGAGNVLQEGHIIGWQGKYAVHHWSHMFWRVLKACWQQERWFARWMALKKVTLSHCFYINHVFECWYFFLDMKHLAVILFTMAFWRVRVSGGRWKHRLKNSRETTWWSNSLTPICVIFGLATDISCPHSKRQSPFSEWWLRCCGRGQTKLKAA